MSWEDYVDDERALRRATECELMDTRAERDAAIAERDRLRAQVTDLLPEADAAQHFATRALRAEDRLDRLRRELETLREELRHTPSADSPIAARLDAILRGES